MGTTNPAPGPVCVGLASSAAPKPPHRGRVGTKSSPGAGLCGAGRLCCTQAAPTGGGWVQQTQPRGRFVWGWPPLLHPSRPHRGRVGYNKPSPGAGLCGAGRLCCARTAPTGGGWAQNPAPGPVCVGLASSAAPKPPPPGAGGHKKPALEPGCVGLAASAAPRPPHRGRVGTKRPSPGAGLCGTGRLCCTQAAPTGGGWAQKHTAPRPVCAELAAGLLHRRRMMKKRRRKG